MDGLLVSAIAVAAALVVLVVLVVYLRRRRKRRAHQQEAARAQVEGVQGAANLVKATQVYEMSDEVAERTAQGFQRERKPHKRPGFGG